MGRLRYASHYRIRTVSAATQARVLGDQLIGSGGATACEDGSDEESLFKAMHTCAYRASSTRCKQPGTPYERRAWARRWRAIRDYILEQNLGLAYSMIGRLGGGASDREALRSEALFALVRAVEGFNPWRGFRFSTYACNAIARAVIQESRRAKRYRLHFALGGDIWQERPDREDRGTELFLDRLRRALEINLGELTDRETVILARRFPSGGRDGLTLGEVGVEMGLSKERVRQIQNRALTKLREVLEADPVLQ